MAHVSLASKFHHVLRSMRVVLKIKVSFCIPKYFVLQFVMCNQKGSIILTTTHVWVYGSDLRVGCLNQHLQAHV